MLLAVTVRERGRREDASRAPGVLALAAFVAVALATTVPISPRLIAWLSPAAARLYAQMLPGWPGGGGWSVARSLAIDPYDVWVEICRFAIGFGVFAVIVAFPWQSDGREENPRTHVFEQLLLTLIVGSVLFALLGLLAGRRRQRLRALGHELRDRDAGPRLRTLRQSRTTSRRGSRWSSRSRSATRSRSPSACDGA